MANSDDLKRLREETGVSLMVCKKALEEAQGDYIKALTVLKKESTKVAEKKSERVTGAGLVTSYVHGGRVGVLIEMRCETDFVSRNPAFVALAHDVAMHVAAMNPHFLSPENVPEEIISEMKDLFKKEVEGMGKNADIVEKILAGKLESYLKDRCLTTQAFIKNPDLTIGEYVKESVQKFGENITISRFTRFEI
jgi:elongation factor Ts